MSSNDTETDGVEQPPTVLVTIETEMTLPGGTSEERALEAARAAFGAEVESDEAEISFQYRGGSDE